MASLEEKVGGGGDIDSYPEPEDEVFVDGRDEVVEDHQSHYSQPDFITSNKLKEQAEEAEKESSSCRSGIQTLKSTFIISGMVVAVLGAICALAKKMKEA